MSKRYKLLKDLPGVKAGAIYKEASDGSDILVCEDESVCNERWGRITNDYATMFPDWLQLLPEKIEITLTWLNLGSDETKTKPPFAHFFKTGDYKIPEEKREAIIRAVEFILNEKGTGGNYDSHLVEAIQWVKNMLLKAQKFELAARVREIEKIIVSQSIK